MCSEGSFGTTLWGFDWDESSDGVFHGGYASFALWSETAEKGIQPDEDSDELGYGNPKCGVKEAKRSSSLVRGTTSLWFFISSMEIRRQKIARDLCEQPYLSTSFLQISLVSRHFQLPKRVLRAESMDKSRNNLWRSFDLILMVYAQWLPHLLKFKLVELVTLGPHSTKASFGFQCQC